MATFDSDGVSLDWKVKVLKGIKNDTPPLPGEYALTLDWALRNGFAKDGPNGTIYLTHKGQEALATLQDRLMRGDLAPVALDGDEADGESDSDEDSVDLIASGYEWTCPNCEHFHKVDEVTETVKCAGCKKVYTTNPPDHAYE